MKHLFPLLALLCLQLQLSTSTSRAQSTGDFLFTKKTASGANTPVWLTPTSTNFIAFNGSGSLTTVSRADYLTTATAASTYEPIITNGSIANTKLANSAITIAGTSTALGGSITLDTITGLSTTGLIKRTGGNTLAVATAGTDYLTPTGSAAGLTNFPTLNQNTTGSAANLTTPRNINGVAFDGSAAITVPTVIATKITATNYTIGTTSSSELYGGVIYVTGAATITIPAVATGASFTVITIGAVAVSVDPNASDLVYLDGTALSDGDKVTNLSTAGDIAVFTYYDSTGWYCASNGWTDGN